MMLFAGLLGARKKVPLWRIGRAKVWMRGHLWLGVLSLPMILYHVGFHGARAAHLRPDDSAVSRSAERRYRRAIQHFLPGR